jgi:AraC-like DNA-binding protein
MDQTISVEALAEMVNMSATTFYRHFKEVMHLPSLQCSRRPRQDSLVVLVQTDQHGFFRDSRQTDDIVKPHTGRKNQSSKSFISSESGYPR